MENKETNENKTEREYKEMLKLAVILENSPLLDPESDYLDPPYGLDIERIESGQPLEDDGDEVPKQPLEME